MALAALKKEFEVWETALKSLEDNHVDEALSAFERQSFDVGQSMEQNTQIIMNMGLISTMKGSWETAIKEYTRAIAQNSYLALAYFQRGYCYYRLERYQEAEADFCTAEVMLRAMSSVVYNEQGLDFTLYKAEVLFNKAATLFQVGREQEGTATLKKARNISLDDKQHHQLITEALNGGRDLILCSVPSGVLYRPTSTRMKFLEKYETKATPLPTNTLHTTKSIPDLSLRTTHEHTTDDDSSTCAGSSDSLPLEKTKENLFSSTRASFSSAFASSSGSGSSSRPLRSDLSKAMGIDILTPTTEISSIPCAGVRIVHGRLTGLMAWRFVVSLEDQEKLTTRRQQMKQRHWQDVALGKAVVVNFLLDTGCANSPVPQEALRALGYRGSYKPGTEVILRVQGVRTKCTVGHLGEAGRLGSQFMTAGSLTFYFDTKLDAPVLYGMSSSEGMQRGLIGIPVTDELNDRPSDIPRTVEPDKKLRRRSFKDGVTALMNSLSLRGRSGSTEI
ncbi:hypothetical protein VNI00_000269 [Paramarasmius palmivorus]|uniref:Uncharacterized protein n=1 Tax=Paramarasmius palmivorus TaxID=297713 RepID=A0AAW0ECS2_9AGAR